MGEDFVCAKVYDQIAMYSQHVSALGVGSICLNEGE